MLHALALHERVEPKGGRVTPTDPGLTTFQRLERPRLSLSIADRLEQAIVSGTLAGGNRLPSEQALADQFQVSCNVVREAFKVLEERGLIEILSGSGTFVRHPGPETTSDALQRYMRLTTGGASIRALFEARRILECANARLPAERADAEDVERLAACVAQMQDPQGSDATWTRADLEFHLGLAKATHNPFLQLLLEPLVRQIRGVIAGTRTNADPTLSGHLRLLDHIRCRDAQGAQDSMLEHLCLAEEARLQASASS